MNLFEAFNLLNEDYKSTIAWQTIKFDVDHGLVTIKNWPFQVDTWKSFMGYYGSQSAYEDDFVETVQEFEISYEKLMEELDIDSDADYENGLQKRNPELFSKLFYRDRKGDPWLNKKITPSDQDITALIEDIFKYYKIPSWVEDTLNAHAQAAYEKDLARNEVIQTESLDCVEEVSSAVKGAFGWFDNIKIYNKWITFDFDGAGPVHLEMDFDEFIDLLKLDYTSKDNYYWKKNMDYMDGLKNRNPELFNKIYFVDDDGDGYYEMHTDISDADIFTFIQDLFKYHSGNKYNSWYDDLEELYTEQRKADGGY